MRRILPYLFSVLLSGQATAQLVVDPNYTPQQLVQDVLVGQGVQVSNVQYSGNNASKGYFDGSNANLGISEGVILCTGKAIDAVGPNNGQSPFGDEGTDFHGNGDPQLTSISATSTFDAANLEFDFIPSSDTVSFRYVFASNEYMYWVGQGFTDVFAFFISGPTITGEQNIALIPGTSTPVTIDNVNANSNSQYYISNENPPGTSVEYNGFTSVFTATAIVTACQQYHIRLVIADGGNGEYDSAVFLEARSFSSPTVSIDPQTNYTNSQSGFDLIEGCSTMSLTFERSAPYSNALTVALDVSGSATNGVDVSNIPNSLTFAPGDSTVTVSFDVLEDGLTEGTEDLTIEVVLNSQCSSNPSASVTVTIEDAEPFTVQTSPDVVFTCPQEYQIDATASGGYGTLTYDWSVSGETGSSITVFPLESTAYTVTVTDECGFSETATTVVNTSGYEPLQLEVADVVVCDGELAQLVANVEGGQGNRTFTWNGASGSGTYTFQATQSTDVAVTVTDDCGLSTSTTASVQVDDAMALFTQQLVRHNAIEFTNTTPNTQSVYWDFGDTLTSDEEMITHYYDTAGTYTVTMVVVNTNGCVDSVIQDVTVYPPLHVYIPNAFTPNEDGINETFGVMGEGYLYYDLEIFDRWGNKILSGRFTDENAWDGTIHGNKAPQGMYVYRVWVQPPIGIEHKESDVLYVLPGK
ncbi:MAG: T9SS type B sorting domain-containing protein [Flavobacteriales bacterium]|nr:T9SS type B sorting domain-containing protein [Flavobacteriales bacterium]